MHKAHQRGDEQENLETLDPERTMGCQLCGENRLFLTHYLGVAIVHGK
jgi:hypothetical protein